MSLPRTPDRAKSGGAAPAPPEASATRLSIAVGPRVIEVLDIAYRARRPVLLEGPTGIGKSQIVSEFAASSGLALDPRRGRWLDRLIRFTPVSSSAEQPRPLRRVDHGRRNHDATGCKRGRKARHARPSVGRVE